MSPGSPPKSYEELIGGLERVVPYRGQRYRVADFLAQYDPTLRVDDSSYSPYDISMNGLSFFAPLDDDRWVSGRQVDLELSLNGRRTYAGRARVARVEDSPRRRRVGLVLLDGIIDLPGVQWQRKEAQLLRDLEQGPETIRALVPPDYRQAVEHALYFLQFYRRSLDEHETHLHEYRADSRSACADELAGRALEAIRPRWHEVRQEGVEVALPFVRNRQVFVAAKKYTEALLTPLLTDAPMLHRSYTKPLGYAGDFQTMLHIYRNRFEGPTAFDRAFHKLCCEVPLAAGARRRRELMVELHNEEYDRFCREAPDDDEPFRVANLGGGPCCEIADFVRSRERWPRPVSWTVLDQEERALSYAHEHVSGEIARCRAPHLFHCWNSSYVQLIKNPSLGLIDRPQHLVYAAGLFDYLRDMAARTLLRVLYDNLVPGGTLCFGNALWPNRHFWMVEFVADWNLVYRTDEEMWDLANSLPDAEQAELTTEPAGAYYFITLRKPR